jgi:hypothetical protein
MFGGLDRDSYDALGDAVVGPIRVHTNLRWVGFYLAHAHAAYGSTWTARRPARTPPVSTWRFLRAEGWGRAPLYLGRQFLPNPGGAGIPNPDWSEANGRTDGRHAAALATTDNPANLVDIESGATIYIDLEADGFMAVPAAVNYLRGWFTEVVAAGYRPGTYCSNRTDAAAVRTTFPNVAIWFFQIPTTQPQVYDESAGRLTLPPASNYHDPGGVMPRFGRVATQFAWYNSSRAFTGAKLKTGATTSHNVAPIDFDAARVTDPAHPEDRAALAFAPFRPGQPAAFALASEAAAWEFFEAGAWGAWGQAAALASATPMADLGYGKWFDTASLAAASRRPGLVDIFGLGIDGSLWTAWRTADVPATGGQPAQDGQWSPTPQILNPAMPARPGCGVAAVSRKTDVLDVFFINRNHELTTTWWTPADMNWQAHTGPITAGFAFAPATNIAAITSPADGERLDLFAVDWSNNIRWSQWRNGGPWRTETIQGVGGIDPAVGVHAAWHGGGIHLVTATRDGSLAHLSHPDGTMPPPGTVPNATGFTLQGTVPGLGAAVRPMGLRLTSLGASLIAVGIASNGALFWAVWNGGVLWIPGLDVAAPAYSTSGRIAATPFGANSMDVMLPNQDGDVVLRRLTVAGIPPLATASVTGSWTLML